VILRFHQHFPALIDHEGAERMLAGSARLHGQGDRSPQMQQVSFGWARFDGSAGCGHGASSFKEDGPGAVEDAGEGGEFSTAADVSGFVKWLKKIFSSIAVSPHSTALLPSTRRRTAGTRSKRLGSIVGNTPIPIDTATRKPLRVPSNSARLIS
jgi:hypothetical protein